MYKTSTGALFACLLLTAGMANAADAPRLAKADRLDMPRAASQTTTHMTAHPAGYYAPDRWSGFYLGGSFGYGFGESRQQLDRNDNHGYDKVSPDGFAASVTLGYNFMFSPSILVGAEADIGIMSLTDDDKEVYDAHSWKPQFGPLWGTLRARAGYLVGDNLLVYGTGGLAWMQTDNWTVGNNWNESSWDSKSRAGWVIGAGVEYALSEKWSARAEYLYMDFGKHHGYTEDNDPYWYDDNVSMLRIGVNYRF